MRSSRPPPGMAITSRTAARGAGEAAPAGRGGALGGVAGRAGCGPPSLRVVETGRLLAHSRGDNTRPLKRMGALGGRDPLHLLGEGGGAGPLRWSAEESI